jgi:hypothetical protein
VLNHITHLQQMEIQQNKNENAAAAAGGAKGILDSINNNVNYLPSQFLVCQPLFFSSNF